MRQMKDSGIEWVGEIPDNWKINRIKYRFSTVGGNGFSLDLQGNESGDYPFCKASDISEAGKILISAHNYVSKGIALSNHFNIIPAGSILFAKIGEAMKKNNRSLCLCECCIDNNCQALTPNLSMHGIFSYYFLKCVDMAWFDNAGTIPCISVRKLMNSPIICPPLFEQKIIADFLDAKCAEIDGLIADIQAEIDTLEQYKRSVITEAVTKGLNPDVEMKDSHIEWVGSIPSRWEVHPLYYYFSERKNKNKLGKETNLLSLSYGRVIRKDINTNEGLLPENYNGYNIVEKGDIVLRLTDLQNDKRSLRTGLIREHGILTSAYVTLMPNFQIESRFFHYVLHFYDLRKVFYNMGNGVRQGLNYDELSKCQLISAPIDEQREVADFLDGKCAEIDEIISTKKTQIDILESYKKSIIFEYVTGKKEIHE